MTEAAIKTEPEEKPLRLDLGCGVRPQEGFVGVDAIKFDGVEVVADLTKPWPWADNSVDEAHCSHFLEHLEAVERVHFVNELYRVLKPGAKCQLIVPHWASCRAYGDPTHKWPAVSEFWFYYLNKEWRLGNPTKKVDANAPHTDKSHWDKGFDCDFDATWSYTLHPALGLRNDTYRQEAVSWQKEAIQDIVATLTKK